MARFEASIEALTAFAGALARYRHRVADALDAAEAEVSRAVAELDGLESDWRIEVARRTEAALECHRMAIYSEYPVDCSPQDWALEQAEQSLVQVLRARREVETEIDRYRNERLDFGDLMDGHFVLGLHYVGECIEGFSRYRTQDIAAPPLERRGQSATPVTPVPPAAVDRVLGTPERRKESEPRDSGPEARW